MKLAHWVQIPPSQKQISGLINSVSELVLAEMEILGAGNVGILDPLKENRAGGADLLLHSTAVKTQPWKFSLEDPNVVNVIHTYPPYTINHLKKTVFLSQGVPEYCWWDELVFGKKLWWQITTLARMCDVTVSWFSRDSEFWSELGNGRVKTIRRGVDLRHYAPDAVDQMTYHIHPVLIYADASRLIKQPFSLLFAVKRAQRVLKDVQLQLVLAEEEAGQGWVPWTNLVTRLGIEHCVPLFLGLIPELRPYLRGSDIAVSPCMWGLTPRVPIEAMACGTPVICFKGDEENPVSGLRVDDGPEAIAAGIIKLWDMVERDPEGSRAKARDCAERYWDIRDTAKALIKVCQELI